MNTTYKPIFRTTVFFLLVGVLMSYKLWLSDRNFPLLPLLEFTSVSATTGYVLFGIWLFLLVVSLFIYRRILVIGIVLLLFFMAMQDQVRWQPWVYHYFMFLIPFCFRKKETALEYFQLILIGIYFWGGINKLTPYFINEVFPFFLKGLTSIELTSFKEIGYIVPVTEIGVALALLFKKLQEWAIYVAFFTHLLIILFLSPLGSNINGIVIPWNLAMMLMLYQCFPKSGPKIMLSRFWKQSAFKVKPLLILFFLCMPVLGFWGKWDYYLSFNLYAGKGPIYQIMIAANATDRLPYDLENVYIAIPDMDDSKILDIYTWSVSELKVPCPPEKRLFTAMAKQLCKAGIANEDLIYMEFKRPMTQGAYATYTCSEVR